MNLTFGNSLCPRIRYFRNVKGFLITMRGRKLSQYQIVTTNYFRDWNGIPVMRRLLTNFCDGRNPYTLTESAHGGARKNLNKVATLTIAKDVQGY